MRVWNVEGADEVTGKDRVVKVKAQDEGEAERMATARGILVSKVYLYTEPAPAPPPRPAPVDPFADVPSSVKRLRAADFVMRVLAGVFIFVAICSAFLMVSEAVSRNFTMAFAALVPVVCYTGAAVLFWGFGAALRMIGSIGIAAAATARAAESRQSAGT